jgi:hypothetical protein
MHLVYWDKELTLLSDPNSLLKIQTIAHHHTSLSQSFHKLLKMQVINSMQQLDLMTGSTISILQQLQPQSQHSLKN